MNDYQAGLSGPAAPGGDLPLARVSRRRWHLPIVWLVPLVAALVAGYLMYDRVRQVGPQITVRFKDASGLKSGQTLVKYRGVPVGEVIAIKLSADLHQALVQVRLQRAAAALARKDSAFWIVRPEVGLGNISGLRTVITGPEIGVQPGSGPPATEFVGLDNAPVTAERNRLAVVLHVGHLGSLKTGSPLYYRGVEVGAVQDTRLSSDATGADVLVFIRPRYAGLVRAGSRFWKVSGVDVNLGLFSGLQVNIESLQALVAGGVAFATPPARSGDAAARPAANGAVFRLFDRPEKAWLNWAPEIAIGPDPGAQASP